MGLRHTDCKSSGLLGRIRFCRLVLVHLQGRFGFPIVKRILVGGQIGVGARHRNIQVGREVRIEKPGPFEL